MPLYEFYCADCRAKFEVLTSYEASQGEMFCATCHGTNVRRLLSLVARPARAGSGGDDFGDFGGDDGDGGDDFGDFGGDDGDGGDDFGGGGCSCGTGACG